MTLVAAGIRDDALDDGLLDGIPGSTNPSDVAVCDGFIDRVWEEGRRG